MYNLSLPHLCAALLVVPFSLMVHLRLTTDSKMHLALYCVVPYIAACVDISGMVLLGPFSPPFASKSFDTCSKAAKQVLMDTQVIY